MLMWRHFRLLNRSKNFNGFFNDRVETGGRRIKPEGERVVSGASA